MRRLICLSLLASLAAAAGCNLCQNCDDYNGSYYGGRVGDWDASSGRAGSVYGGGMPHESTEPYETSVSERPRAAKH